MFAAFTDRYVNMSQNGADLIGSHHLEIGLLSGNVRDNERSYKDANVALKLTVFNLFFKL